MVLTPLSYHTAHFMVFWIAGAGFLMGANNIMGTGIWVMRRTIFTSYAQIFTFLTVIPASYVLIPKYGAVGAAIAYFLGTTSQSVAFYIFAQRLYRIPYRYWSIHIMLGLTLLLAWAHSQFVKDETVVFSFLYGCVTFIAISVLAYLLSFDRDTRSKIYKYVLNRFNNV